MIVNNWAIFVCSFRKRWTRCDFRRRRKPIPCDDADKFTTSFKCFPESCADRSGWFWGAARGTFERQFWKKYFQNSILNDRSTKRDFVSFFTLLSATEFQKILMRKPNILGTWDLIAYIFNPLSIFTKIFKTVVDHLTLEIEYLRGYIRQISNSLKMLDCGVS